MSNPFENVPSSADVPHHRQENRLCIVRHCRPLRESSLKKRGDCQNEEELAGVIFDLLLDDDGSVKDFGHAAEIRGLIDEAWKQQERGIANLGEIINPYPQASGRTWRGRPEAARFQFQELEDVFRLYLPSFGIVGAIVGIV